jgi:hypothetical protein
LTNHQENTIKECGVATTEIAEIESVEELDGFQDEYVYDIGVANNDPYFFANDILVHNSCYFTMTYSLNENDIQNLNINNVTEAYDYVSNQVSDSFPEFMKEEFGVDLERGAIIKSGREVIGRSGLFITKKRYAINCLHIEDKCYAKEDLDLGKLKAMGIEIKRSDTPKEVQDFLERILMMALSGHSEDSVIEEIRQFRAEFRQLPAWNKGMPKTVKRLSYYENILLEAERGVDYSQRKVSIAKSTKVTTIPGHVRASINWNRLKDMNGDRYSMNITEGQKIIVCKLKNNPLGYTSVAYPSDEPHLPEWFKELPFDESHMENSVLEKKINNVLGVRGWNLDMSRISDVQARFFSFI